MAVPWRRVTPCLLTQPWTSALVGTRLHLLKGVFLEDGYEVAVWDTRVMWVERIDREPLLERMKELNPNVEAPVSLILAQLSSLLHTPLTQYTEATPTVRETTPTAEGEKTLAVNGTMSGLPFTWQFKCTRTTDNSMLQSHLIGPLIACLTELSRQKEELVGIIKRKDREIQEYKENGATVSRRHLETTAFDDKTFNTAMVYSQEFEESVRNATNVLSSKDLQSLYSNVGMVTVWQEMAEGATSSTNVMMSCDNTTGTWAEKIPSSLLPPPLPPSLPSPPHTDTPPAKDEELGRRVALERKLEEGRGRGKKKRKRLM